MLENVRTKAEDFRSRIQTRVAELRGGGAGAKGGLFSSPDVLKGALATEIREKGVIATARERVTKFRGGKGLGSMFGSDMAGPSPAAPPTPAATMYPAAAEQPVRVDLSTRPRLY